MKYQDHPSIVTALANLIWYADDRASTQEELEHCVVYWLNDREMGKKVDTLMYATADAMGIQRQGAQGNE